MNSKLIINADDFGFDKDTFESTVALFENGILSSATIMTDMLYSRQAMEYAINNQDKFSFELYFNIIDNHISKYGNNSLTNSKGVFNNSNLQRKKEFDFFLKNDILEILKSNQIVLINWNQL